MNFPSSFDERLQLLRRIQDCYHPFIYQPRTYAKKYVYDSEWNSEQKILTAAKIQVRQVDTLAAAGTLQNPLVLILADDIFPGGNYLCVAGMQEESLFLRSALWRHLTKDMYPILANEAIYAKDVPILDGNIYSFIACPGLKMPRLIDGKLSAEDRCVLTKKVELILQVASANGHRNFVLGALGNGVWSCPAKCVADIFKDVLRQNSACYDDIIFAILGANCNTYKIVFENGLHNSHSCGPSHITAKSMVI